MDWKKDKVRVDKALSNMDETDLYGLPYGERIHSSLGRLLVILNQGGFDCLVDGLDDVAGLLDINFSLVNCMSIIGGKTIKDFPALVLPALRHRNLSQYIIYKKSLTWYLLKLLQTRLALGKDTIVLLADVPRELKDINYDSEEQVRMEAVG